MKSVLIRSSLKKVYWSLTFKLETVILVSQGAAKLREGKVNGLNRICIMRLKSDIFTAEKLGAIVSTGNFCFQPSNLTFNKFAAP